MNSKDVSAQFTVSKQSTPKLKTELIASCWISQGLVSHGEQLGVYSNSGGHPLEDFDQEQKMF